MSFAFHPEAEAELNEAVEYYEGVEPRLGYEFALEAHAAVHRAVAYPQAWPALEGEVRRSLLKRFPYGVLWGASRRGRRRARRPKPTGTGWKPCQGPR